MLFMEHTAFEEASYEDPAFDVAMYYVDAIARLISSLQLMEYDHITKTVGDSLNGLFSYIMDTITSLQDEKLRDTLVIEYAGLLLSFSCYHLEDLWKWDPLEPFAVNLTAVQKREVIDIVKAYIPCFYDDSWEFDMLRDIISAARWWLKKNK